MNPTTIDRIDHIGLIGPSLDELARKWTSLGFSLTPPSRHAGPLEEGDKPALWGTANRCAMLQEGYIELLAVVDPTQFQNGVQEFLVRYAGIHIVAFGCSDARAEAARLVALGFDVAGVARLERQVTMPDGGQERMRFKLVRLTPAQFPEGRIIVIEHETPDLLWPKDLKPQAIGEMLLSDVVMVVADVEEATRRYARLLGVEAERGGSGNYLTIGRAESSPAAGEEPASLLGYGRLVITSAPRLQNVLDGAVATTVPFIAGAVIVVDDLAALADSFIRRKVAARYHNAAPGPFAPGTGQIAPQSSGKIYGSIVVPADQTGGATLEFIEA